MVSIRWCAQQKKGLEIVEPNTAMANSYLKMAEESISVLKGVEKSALWTATTTYYIFYYSLYSLMMRVGLKCEIHTCTLECMKHVFMQWYEKKDIEMIGRAFQARIDLQYYADRPVDTKVIEETKRYCKEFFIKTKDIISKIRKDDIDQIQNRIRKEL